MYEKRYFDIRKFKLYPRNNEVKLINKEFKFYQRYFLALEKYVSSNIDGRKITKKTIVDLCNEFSNKVKKLNFDYTKYFANDHFLFAKENLLKKLLFRKKENIKKYIPIKRTIKLSGYGCFIMNDYFYLKNVPKIKIRPKLEMYGDFTFITITKIHKDFFLTIVKSVKAIDFPKTGVACGIDIGFKEYTTIYDSNDDVTKIDFKNDKLDTLVSKANFYKKVLVNIENKNINYKKSKNYIKILSKLEKVYRKISNIQANFYSRITNLIVKKYDLITIESINLESLYKVRTSKINLQRRSFGKFFKVLEDKCKKYNKKLIKADQLFMSSQICSSCGVVHHEMKDYTLRRFKCECGYEADRDENAAKNLMYYGIRFVRYKNVSLEKGKNEGEMYELQNKIKK